MSLCILLSTCEKYRWLAQFAECMLDRHWAEHPPVYVCGCAGENLDHWLSLRSNPRDWMNITLAACSDLAKRGYTKCYLILDDHMPFADCHEAHLNTTLPFMMDKLDAAYIGLLGWERNGSRMPNGAMLGQDFYRMENVSKDYLWKFSLHPGLWDLRALTGILKTLVSNLPLEDRSPWNFERMSGAPGINLPNKWEYKCYRICGRMMARNPFFSTLYRFVEVGFCNVAHIVARLGGKGVRRRVDEATAFISYSYDGPYPLVWRGIMSKGGVNKDFLRYMRFRGYARFLSDFEKVLPSELRIS